MLKLYLLSLFLLFGWVAQAQDFSLTSSQVETSSNQARELIGNYEISLNNLGDSLTTVQEKTYFVADILESIFQGEDVLVYNDLDPDNTESKDITISIYLNNIITKFYKGIRFNYSDINISGPYYLGENSFFVKAELASNLEGTHIDQSINTFEAIDIYLKYAIDELYNISQPTIYSITQHRENLNQFTPVRIEQGAGIATFDFINPGKRLKFKRGKEYMLEWKSNNTQTPVRLELHKGNNLVLIINPVVVGNKFRWRVPNDMALGKNYKIRIVNLKNRENRKDSPFFRIKRKVPLGLKLGIISGAALGAGYYFFIMEDGGSSKDNLLPEPPSLPDR